MTRLLAALLPLSLMLAACGADPIATANSGNPDVQANLIAEVDGCRIWRIRDGNERKVYMANCAEGDARTEWTTGGKHKSYHETLTVRP